MNPPILKTSTSGEDIILDFFSGSGTTAQAVFELNIDDGNQRRLIAVQMPELLDEDSEGSKADHPRLH